MGALRLCLDRILPPCRERTIKFDLPSIESGADIAAAMKAVTAALAGGIITPGEAEAIARLVDTFIQAIETATDSGWRYNVANVTAWCRAPAER